MYGKLHINYTPHSRAPRVIRAPEYLRLLYQYREFNATLRVIRVFLSLKQTIQIQTHRRHRCRHPTVSHAVISVNHGCLIMFKYTTRDPVFGFACVKTKLTENDVYPTTEILRFVALC